MLLFGEGDFRFSQKTVKPISLKGGFLSFLFKPEAHLTVKYMRDIILLGGD